MASSKYRDRDLFLLALQVLARFTEGIEISPTVRKRLAEACRVNEIVANR